MIICGIKATHDAAVALVDGSKLIFSVEMEKLDNRARYSRLGDVAVIPALLSQHGYDVDDVDSFVVDGWHGEGEFWRGKPTVKVIQRGESMTLEVAGYSETSLRDDVFARQFFPAGLKIADGDHGYASYLHAAGHILGTYCASPYSRAREDSYVLVWDGGVYPRLYFVDGQTGKVQNKGHLFMFLGTIYAIIGHYFGPYSKSDAELAAERESKTMEGYFGGYSIAGKLMAYIALGEVRPDLIPHFQAAYESELEISNRFEHRYAQEIKRRLRDCGYSDADVLRTHHAFLENMLLHTLEQKLARERRPPQNLCFCGGSALNIKWNSRLRDSGLFKSVWVPPFPNDSGSAIGMAACEMVATQGELALDWQVYSGPAIRGGSPLEGWMTRACSVAELADLLVREGEPVVFLLGRAELGPRALGHRSIFAPATSPGMKGVLNWAKKREDFRPIAPICMEGQSSEVFEPGGADPFMLFDHRVRDAWLERVPAICHLDGTARLQTVNEASCPEVWALLKAYHAKTGIPLLCNTSANLNGSGFFPDVESAMRWGKLNYVWCEGTLFERADKRPLEG